MFDDLIKRESLLLAKYQRAIAHNREKGLPPPHTCAASSSAPATAEGGAIHLLGGGGVHTNQQLTEDEEEDLIVQAEEYYYGSLHFPLRIPVRRRNNIKAAQAHCLGHELASGGSARVIAVKRPSGRTMALKEAKAKISLSGKTQDYSNGYLLKHEVAVLQNISHPHIVRIVEAFSCDTSFTMNLAQGGDLQSYLAKRTNCVTPTSSILLLAAALRRLLSARSKRCASGCETENFLLVHGTFLRFSLMGGLASGVNAQLTCVDGQKDGYDAGGVCLSILLQTFMTTHTMRVRGETTIGSALSVTSFSRP